MKIPRLGQEQGREQRSREYAEWAGAKLVQADGSIETSPQAVAEHDEHLAQTDAAAIKIAIDAGINEVSYSRGNPAVVARLRELLTPEQLSHVRFTFFEVPQPSRTVRV